MMSRGACPQLPASLAACRMVTMDPKVAAHVASCPDCGPAVALDRALARVAACADTEPYPPSEAVRIESLLIVERRRLARAAAVQVGLHGLAFVVCVALLAAAWLLDFHAGATFVGALVAVAMSMWSLVRAVDEAALIA